ncbi:L-lactate MFS transporter [Atopobium fossor]|uniref:L-lactate MFS transporter n=1 Tax=Atopobium fossor TaxID=39487 RepID=UPI0003FF02A9|nr:OFA family MFS transporter [Atopobium fossor]
MQVSSNQYNRWFVLAASCAINLCIGSIYAWSVFALPMQEHLSHIAGTNIGSLAIVFTLANAVGPITMISGGAITKKIGVRNVVRIGGLLFCVGMILSGFTKSLPELLLTYGLGVGLGVGMVYGATVSNTVKFFPDKRGLAGGITTAFYGLSSVLIPVIANALINNFSIVEAFWMLGIAMLLLIMGASFAVASCPDGYAPTGWTKKEIQVRDIATQNAVQVSVDKTWREMLSDPIFYIMIAMLLCGAFSGLMITSQASAIAQRMVQMDTVLAALIVSVLALFNTAGRIVSGVLSDRLGIIRTLRLMFVLLIVGMALLLLSARMGAIVFIIAVCVVGFVFGSVMGIYPGFTAAQFGNTNNSVNYGIMFIGFATAGFFGPTAMNILFNNTGSYIPAFAVAATLGVLGVVLSFLYERATKVQHVSE